MKQLQPFTLPNIPPQEMQIYAQAMMKATANKIWIEVEMKKDVVLATVHAIRHTFPEGLHANDPLSRKAEHLALWVQLQLNFIKDLYRMRFDPFHTWLILYCTQRHLEITANMINMPVNYLLATQLSDVLRTACPEITPLIAKGWEMQKIA